MRRTNVIGLCLVAVLAVLGSMVASASAETLPALYECAKVAKTEKGKGIYNKGCIVLGKHGLKENEYEIKEGWGILSKKTGEYKTFKGKGVKGSKPSLTIPGIGTVTCASFTDEGQFTGEKAVSKLHASFKGCAITSTKCYNKGATETERTAGDISTRKLKGVVGYTDAAIHQVGVKLSLENPTEKYEAVLECGPANGTWTYLRVSGAVIGIGTPVNVFTKEAHVNFQEESDKQIPEQFEGGLPEEAFLQTESAGATEGGIEPPVWGPPIHSAQTAEAINKGEYLMLKA